MDRFYTPNPDLGPGREEVQQNLGSTGWLDLRLEWLLGDGVQQATQPTWLFAILLQSLRKNHIAGSISRQLTR